MVVISDAAIWRCLREIDEQTGWPPQAVKDAVAERLGVDAERVAQVWRERLINFGG